MKISILKDLHASGYRREAWRAQFVECLAIAAETDAIIFAGDVFDSENVFDSRASTGDIAGDVISCIEWARRTYPNFPPIHAMVGNHDLPKGNALDALAVLEPVGVKVHRGVCGTFQIVAKAQRANIMHLNWSWEGTNPEAQLYEFLSDLCSISKRILLTHCDVTGARMNGGKIAEPGKKRWALSREFLELAATRFDFIECAHYHGEQRIADNAWIGPAMIQTGFGHADEPQGFVILDTETGERRRVDVNEAPPHVHRFVTTPEQAMEAAAMIAEAEAIEEQRIPAWIVTDGFTLSQTDQVALAARGIRVSPANLPVPTRVGRSVEIATDSRLTDPLEILRLYDAAQEEHATADEIEARAALVSEVLAGSQDVTPRIVAGAGSVTPIRATLRGIGPYVEETTIDFAAMGRVVAVHGTNGVGKTIGIGSIFLALYNAIPGYNGNGFGMVTGADGIGTVALDFKFRGEAYRIERAFKVGSSNVQNASLVLPNGEVIVGPDSVKARIKALIGTGDAALATCWVSADRDNDICGAGTTDSERRIAFSQFLGMGWLDSVAKTCGDAMREARSDESALAARINGAGDLDARVAKDRDGAEQARAHREQMGRELEAAKARFAAVEGEARGTDADEETHRAAIAEHERNVKAVAEAERTLADVKTRRGKAAEARIREGVIFNESLPELERLEAEETRLQKQRTLFVNRADWERKEREAERALADAEAKLRAATIALDPADETLAATREDWVGRGKARRAEIARVEATNAEIRGKEIERDTRIASIRQDIAALERRIASRPPLPFLEKCETSGCAFLAEQAGLPAQLAELKARLAEQEAIEVPALLDVPSIAEIEAGYALANAAAQRVEAARKSEREAEAHRAARQRAQDALEWIRLDEPARVEDPGAELLRIAQMIRDLIAIKGTLELVRAEAAGYDALDAEMVRTEARLDELNLGAGASVIRAANAQRALEDSAAAKAEMDRRVASARAALTLAETEYEAARENLSNAVASLSRLEDFSKEIASLRVRADALALRGKRLEWARLAFGKEGVQPIIIDSAAAPSLEARVNSLLLDVTGGAVQIRIVTRELTDKGEIREVFRVEARDGGGEFRDIALYSGGERERVQIVFRAALAMELGALVGAPCESIVIDEAFNKLSPENVPAMVEVLEALGSHFAQIVVLTPNPGLAARFASSVHVTPGPGGAPVWPVNSQEVVW